MADPVVWFEVTGPDPEGAAKFYGELFGWHAQPIPDMDYLPVDTHAGRGINGGVGEGPGGGAPAGAVLARGAGPPAGPGQGPAPRGPAAPPPPPGAGAGGVAALV